MANSETQKNAQKDYGNMNANDYTRLLLDATPLACRLMKRVDDGKYELFECNEESVKLFKFKDKQEFINRYFEIFPELQPDGSVSLVAGQKLFDEAYKNGRSVSEFFFRTADGDIVPTEVTLVRLEYENEYIIAGYTRDLREHQLMIETIENRSRLLNAGNLSVQALLSTDEEADISEALLESLEVVGVAMDADRVQIWRNEMIGGSLHFVHAYEWLSDTGKNKASVPIGMKLPYSVIPKWEEFFSSGEYINGLLTDLSEEEQRFLSVYDIKSIVIIPLIIKNVFWGFFKIDDCESARLFRDDEITILGSISRMLVSALNRNAQVLEIRESHNRIRILLDKMPFACHLWNSNFEMIECNEENTQLFNVTDKNELMSHFSRFTPEYQPNGRLSEDIVHDFVRRAYIEGKCVCDEFIHLTSDGTQIPVEIILVRIPFEGGFAVAAYLRDLREQKEMLYEIQLKTNLLGSMNQAATILLQSELEEFENNLQICMGMIGEAVNADRICIWKNSTIDGKLHCTLVNEWITSEHLRTDAAISTDVPYEGNIPTFERLLQQGECINSLTVDLSAEEQARLDLHGVKSIFVAPVFIHGEFWGFVGCDNCYDETIFSAEVATTLRSGSLLIANALLRNEMTLNLQKAATELKAALLDTQKANNAKSDFLASMSHEMRTPLNAIIGLTWLSLENERLDPEIHANLEKIHNAGTSLLGIVNDILDISKIESGKLELVPIEFNVASLINDTVTQNLLRIGDKPIELKLDVDKNLFVSLYGDELRLKQIINNLLSNAIKYTIEGQVELSVGCARDDNTVWLTIKVSDTGLGIKKEDIGRLFDNYSQLDTLNNRKIEGTGLGLPITKKLCELMHGTVSVESDYGAGSVFTARLKLVFVTDAIIGPEVVSSLNSFRYTDGRRADDMRLKRIRLPNARVLVVDDNPTNLDVARGLMKPYGMRVDCVDSGQKAIDAICTESDRYDAIFMDQMMPGMDGIEAVRRIRALSADYAKNIPIIALTANAVVGNEDLFLSKGFQAFLSKPIDITRLDAVIRQWIRDNGKEQLPVEAERPDENRNKEVSLLSGKEVTGLDIESGIKRFGGDEEIYISILRSYAANTKGLLDTMEVVTSDKLNNYEINVHSVKGSSFGICADVVGKLAKELEYAAKTGDLSYIGSRNHIFLETARKLISDIDDMLLSLESDNPKPIKDKPDGLIVSRLISACESYDMDEVDAAMAEIAEYRYEADAGLVDWLQENIDLMNFDEIIEKLSGL